MVKQQQTYTSAWDKEKQKQRKPDSAALKHLYERFVEGDTEQEADYEEYLNGKRRFLRHVI